MISFREYLEKKCSDNYTGLDDNYPDYEASWFADLDPEDVIAWAEAWGLDMYEKGIIWHKGMLKRLMEEK